MYSSNWAPATTGHSTTPLSGVADSFSSSSVHSCYYRYQNPALPIAGRVDCEVCGNGGEEEDGRSTALNTSVCQGHKAPKFGLSLKSSNSPPGPGVVAHSCCPLRPSPGQLCERRLGRAAPRPGGSGQAGGSAASRPHSPQQQGRGSQQLLGQVEPGSREPGREHQAAAAPT